jgi:hypothetical protein
MLKVAYVYELDREVKEMSIYYPNVDSKAEWALPRLDMV